MGKTLSISNNKGGVGKTHTTFHLAGAFAQAGQRAVHYMLRSRFFSGLLLAAAYACVFAIIAVALLLGAGVLWLFWALIAVAFGL